MLHLCVPSALTIGLAGAGVLVLGAILLVNRKARQRGIQVDGNALLILELSILAGFIILVFVFFVFAWTPC